MACQGPEKAILLQWGGNSDKFNWQVIGGRGGLEETGLPSWLANLLSFLPECSCSSSGDKMPVSPYCTTLFPVNALESYVDKVKSRV